MNRPGPCNNVHGNIPRRPETRGSRSYHLRPGRLIALIALPVACLAICRSGPDLRDPQGFRPTRTAAVSGPPAAIIHVITPDCVSAQQIARAHDYRGDWRDYMELIRQANGWRGWPLLQAGDRILIPAVNLSGNIYAPIPIPIVTASSSHVGQAPRSLLNPPPAAQGKPARTHHVSTPAVPGAAAHSREVAF